MTGGWPEQECFALFRLTSNQIRSLSCTVSSRVSDDSGFRLRKTFITALNTWGHKKNTSFLPHGYDVVRDVRDWCNRVTSGLYALRYTSHWGLQMMILGLTTHEEVVVGGGATPHG